MLSQATRKRRGSSSRVLKRDQVRFESSFEGSLFLESSPNRFSLFFLTLTFTLHQTGLFLEILFKIRNQKILFFVKTPKNNFSDPQSTNPDKTRRKHF